MTDKLSKNPIVKPEDPGRFKMEVKKDRVVIEFILPKGSKSVEERTGVKNFNFDIPIKNPKDVAKILRDLSTNLEEDD